MVSFIISPLLDKVLLIVHVSWPVLPPEPFNSAHAALIEPSYLIFKPQFALLTLCLTRDATADRSLMPPEKPLLIFAIAKTRLLLFLFQSTNNAHA